nr:hypothetical protein [uncultured Capnocytophaga sp.]
MNKTIEPPSVYYAVILPLHLLQCRVLSFFSVRPAQNILRRVGKSYAPLRI